MTRLLHLSRVPLAPARSTNQPKSPESLGSMAEFELSASAIRHFPTKMSSPFFEPKKCIKQQASWQDCNKICGFGQKTNCCKLLKLQHPACQRPHAIHGKTCSAPKMDTTVQAMFLFSFWPIWTSAQTRGNVIRTFIISPKVVGLLGTAAGRLWHSDLGNINMKTCFVALRNLEILLVHVNPSLNQKTTGMMEWPIVKKTCPDCQPDICHDFNCFTTLQYFHLWL